MEKIYNVRPRLKYSVSSGRRRKKANRCLKNNIMEFGTYPIWAYSALSGTPRPPQSSRHFFAKILVNGRGHTIYHQILLCILVILKDWQRDSLKDIHKAGIRILEEISVNIRQLNEHSQSLS